MVVRALAGKAIVEPELEREEVVGGIIMPHSKARGFAGRILSITPEQGKTTDLKPGDRVVTETYCGTQFEWEGRVLRVVPIWAISMVGGDDAPIHVHAPGVPRCRFCRSKGPGNIILRGDGFCPICLRNSAGEKYRKPSVRLTEEDRRVFGGPEPVHRKKKIIVGHGRARS